VAGEDFFAPGLYSIVEDLLSILAATGNDANRAEGSDWVERIADWLNIALRLG
jgi:hypothetical protein